MEFRNLFSHVSSELLDDYADPRNSQQYWIKNTRKNKRGGFIVYKGSFPNEKKRL